MHAIWEHEVATAKPRRYCRSLGAMQSCELCRRVAIDAAVVHKWVNPEQARDMATGNARAARLWGKSIGCANRVLLGYGSRGRRHGASSSRARIVFLSRTTDRRRPRARLSNEHRTCASLARGQVCFTCQGPLVIRIRRHIACML